MNFSKLDVASEIELEELIGKFEANWQPAPDLQLTSWLPHDSSSFYREALVELVRVDMELRWNAGCPRPLGEYLEQLPQLGQDQQALEQVAFEEYRLRFGQDAACEHQGDSVGLRHEYAERYGINVGHWPIWNQQPSADAATRADRWTSERDPFPEVGQHFCGFKLVGLLGQGACGKVFLARQDDLANRLISLKVTTEKSRESWHLARLQHTHIIPVHSVHQIENLTALCMPFLGMSTLKDLIAVAWNQSSSDEQRSSQALISTANMARAQSVLETIRDNEEKRVFEASVDSGHSQRALMGTHQQWIDLAINLTCGIGEGLSHAHEKGLVHGDIKPANILLSDEQQPVLLDFHLSRATVDGVQQKDWIGGTLPYMSPEQIRGLETGEDVDARADVFSLGVVLFQLLTGQLPYGGSVGDSVQEMIDRRNQSSPSTRNHSQNISVDIDSIVGKCLAANLQDRYQSADQLVTDLRLHQANRPLQFAPNRSWKERAKKFLRRHPRLTSAASIAAISLVVLTGLALALANRADRIADLNAANESRQFVEQLAEAKLAMSVITSDVESINEANQETRQLLDRYESANPEQWAGNDRQRRLNAEQVALEKQKVGETLFWLAEAGRHSAYGQTDTRRKNEILERSLADNQLAEQFLADMRPLIGTLLQHAKIAFAQGDAATANKLLAQTAELDPQSATDYLMATLMTEASPVSVQYAEKLIEQDGRNHAAWLAAGRAFLMHGQKERGIACFQMAVSLNPENSHAQWLLGRGRFELQDLRGALQAYERIDRHDPAWLGSLLNRGIVRLELGQAEKAEAIFDQAIEEGAINSRVWYLRSEARAMRGRNAAAATDLKKFMQLEPCDAEGYLTRGGQFIPDQPQRAIADLKHALDLNPRSATAIQNISYVYSDVLTDIPESIRWVDKLVALDDSNPVYLTYRGVLNARNGDRDAAHKDAVAAIKIRDDADTLYRVAGIYAQTGKQHAADLQHAMALISQACFLNPKLVLDFTKIDPDIKPLEQLEAFQDLLGTLKKLEKTRTKR